MKLYRNLLLAALLLSCGMTQAQKYVGGDLSLVPAYEAAGDQWLDANGNVINSYYSDGMITFMHDVAGWNSVRVRLLLDPSIDGKLATCQDLEYVKKLGKRIKDADMNFLLDIFYSDTWTDVNEQWIPTNWGCDRNTDTNTLKEKVKSYTTEVLNALTNAGAKPDFIQLGNEVSYGMLWDSYAGKNKTKNWFITSSSYESQKANIDRFAALLNAAKEGVNASSASSAKIILHCERTANAAHCVNFYKWVEQSGFTGYDIIGLSYYPFWHNGMATLKGTLTQLQKAFPNKDIHIVETGYFNNNGVEADKLDYNTSSTWEFSPAGQAQFLKDLVATLKNYSNVKGLYYWQPEECGNGAIGEGDNAVKRVMDDWDNRGWWQLTYLSGTHAFDCAASMKALKTFIGEETEDTDVTGMFQNMDFESCVLDGNVFTECPGWTISETGWGEYKPWPTIKNEWHSSLTSGYLLQGWCKQANTLSAGNIIYQSKDNMPAGTYIVTAIVHTDYNGIYLFANDDERLVNATPTWGTAYEVSVTTTLNAPGTLTVGLKLNSSPTSSNELNLYADNFICHSTTAGIETVTVNKNSSKKGCYNLAGQRVAQPSKGLYIIDGKKVVIK